VGRAARFRSFESRSFSCANVCRMDDERLVLGPADARWNDYVGTAAADDAPVAAGLVSLYSIAGVDRDRWTIVGMDISRWDQTHRVVVYAVDRLQPDLEGEEESPMTALRLSDSVRMEDFIAKAFQGISIRLMSRLHQGRRLPVVSGDELPVVPPDEANGAPGETQGSADGVAASD
jgi:hypothetical protein